MNNRSSFAIFLSRTKMSVIEVEQVTSLITVMLGMSAVRTYEKRTGIAK
jgi:hypothetical protein